MRGRAPPPRARCPWRQPRPRPRSRDPGTCGHARCCGIQHLSAVSAPSPRPFEQFLCIGLEIIGISDLTDQLALTMMAKCMQPTAVS